MSKTLKNVDIANIKITITDSSGVPFSRTLGVQGLNDRQLEEVEHIISKGVDLMQTMELCSKCIK